MEFEIVKLSSKGQVVIPSEARTAMKLKKSEKLLVFGMGEDMLVISKLSNLEKFAKQLTKRLGDIQEIMKETKGKK